ncbi:MAG: hypothetical protein AABX47_02340 [Nanoarchaeota archaeon]
MIKTYEETERIGPYLAIPLVATTSGLRKYGLTSYSRLGLYYTDNVLYPLMVEGEARAVSKGVVEKILSDERFVKEVYDGIVRRDERVHYLLCELQMRHL